MRRTLTELLNMLAAIVGTAIAASLAAWAVTSARDTIWEVAFVAMAIIGLMGIRPVRAAWRLDKAGQRP